MIEPTLLDRHVVPADFIAKATNAVTGADVERLLSELPQLRVRLLWHKSANEFSVTIEDDGLGQRRQSCEGDVYYAVVQRVPATLKRDPDLRQLEEEAEDEISSLEAGDEAVRAALDQLIEEYHASAERPRAGNN
jgi:hypothetical protein